MKRLPGGGRRFPYFGRKSTSQLTAIASQLQAAQKSRISEKPDNTEPPEALAIVYAALVAIWDKEADRFWVRNNVMLLANGALAGYYFQTRQDRSATFGMAVAAMGFILASIWMTVNLKGGYYVARWRPAIEQYERFMNTQAKFGPLPLTTVRPDSEVDFLKYKGKKRRERIKNILTGKYVPRSDAGDQVHFLAISLAAVWVVVFVLNLIAMIRVQGTTSPPGQPSSTTSPASSIISNTSPPQSQLPSVSVSARPGSSPTSP